MIERLETKACTNCAKSRRKCGKQHPTCLRCRNRRLSCNYPPPKPTSFVPLLEDATPSAAITGITLALPSPLDLYLPVIDTHSASSWFASPLTWAIDPPPQSLTSNPSRFSSSDFTRSLQHVFQWLTQWIKAGSCPFIHRQLYRTYFPPAIQSAYTSLSAYLHKTPANAGIVCTIIEGRATQLVADGLLDFSSISTISTTETLDNLSRVQALLVYQCIGLYDGDLRLRRLAEQHIPVMEDWVGVLMQQASQTLSFCSTPAFATPIPMSGAEEFQPLAPSPLGPDTFPSSHHLWFAWILAESVRRLWLITAGLQGLYKLFSNPNPTKPCMGGTMFTSRQGFWEAPSAGAWEKRCTERFAGLVRLTETDKLFSMVPKGELNEFARLVLQCTFGLEWCEMVGV
ncbi:hypothetical protein BDV96DRAFT_588009 [Lophiotrema nucula]|uniref:Zn(2)-C6 fungal-type domain-containing protein n=1 Tax=Lophiotrema nucula TaxID=690887 RepID=A0A6A5YLI9_9PLEO|nr:hypothetical protein BDV96DRAFT_588009 [Lophiotrema nucula]